MSRLETLPYPHGPTFHDDGRVAFRVWAPHASSATLHLCEATHELSPRAHGWFEAVVPARSGDRYGYSLDGGPVLPDPASRRQPDGVHERSALVDPGRFRWSPGEAGWQAPPLGSGVIYELHVGTFTPEGTLAAAAANLGAVADLGVTHVEVMPVNACNGSHGWGYDGVAWFAVHEPYGGPEAFAAFVDACHRHRLGVVLDVVYNHLGPSGNYLPDFGPYLASRGTGWGDAINLDGPGSDPVRALVLDNARFWFEHYHVDALRLDAVHALVDTSAVHLVTALSAEAAALSRTLGRRLELVAESDRNDPATLRSREVGGQDIDAQWSDDLHHAIHVAVTGERDGYYEDYVGLPDVAEAYVRGFVFDGARYSTYRGRTVGAPLGDVPGTRLVACIQNHDQVGNRPRGERLATLTDPDRLRVAVLLLCAAPHVPMLFMGDEHAETNPFQFFSSHPEPELAEAVRKGRAEEFAAFAAFAGEVPDPQDPAAVEASRVDWSRAGSRAGAAHRALWRDALAARRRVPALGNGRRDLVDVHVADATRLALTRRDRHEAPVALVANLADEPATFEDLPVDGSWRAVLDTGDERYGGPGDRVEPAASLLLPPRRAVLLAPG